MRVTRGLLAAACCALVSCTAGHPPQAVGRSGSSTPPSSAPASSTAPPPAPASTAPTATCPPADWTPRQQAAALLVAPTVGFDAAALAPVLREGVGGVLLLGNGAPADLAQQVAAAQREAPVRLFVMADEEGGGIQRLAGLVPPLPWPRQLAASRTPAQAEGDVAAMARGMRSLGVGVDLAPVADVDAGPGPSESNPDGRRSFSGDVTVAGTYAAAFVRGLAAGGVMAVVKHFPGLGGSSGNTDYGSARTLPLSSLEQRSLPAFAAAVAAGAPGVMLANAQVPGLTSLPASLSPAVVSLLRDRLGFRGLVLTDSLSAGAISSAGYDLPHAAAAAVAAGADLVLFGSTLTAQQRALLAPDQVARTVRSVVDQLVRGVAPARLAAAARAVLAAKGVAGCTG